jgi:CRP-like cAMP-binding protein
LAVQLRKDAKLALLAKIPLFRHCTKKELAEIATIADELDLKEGTELTKEGKRGREFFAIVEGEADVLMGGTWVNSVRQGDFLGEISLVTGRPRTATVKATTPIRVVVITAQNFNTLLLHNPEIQRKILVSLAERLATATL